MIDWQKIHRFQEKPGWCGPAVIQMVLLAVGLEKSQEEIEKDVNLDWWGTTQGITVAYLSRFFKKLGYKENSAIEDVAAHIKNDHIVIVDWWDDLDEGEADGHYSIVAEYDEAAGELTMVDPSNSRRGIWKMKLEDFQRRWYDNLDIRGEIKTKGYFIWVDPASKL